MAHIGQVRPPTMGQCAPTPRPCYRPPEIHDPMEELMRKAFATMIGILAVLLVPVIDAGAQALAVYDNFNSATIDPVRWRGFEQAAGDAIINTEATRRIVSGQLEMALTTHGGTASDTGATGEGR